MDAGSNIQRARVTVRGIVQGVGFRPFVYRLATDCRLAGSVRNNGDGVEIEIQGERVDEFVRRLPLEAPPLAMIVDLETEPLEPADLQGFGIVPSDDTPVGTAYIPADIAVCDDCLRELSDPEDRRYRYPFINCTNCGPRYTITESIPSDRPKTSMKNFRMCPDCEKEYHDPSDRRFHAQPNACPDCGPRLTFRWNSPNGELPGFGIPY